MTGASSAVVLSQLPPPHHGSTIMTQLLVDELSKAGVSVHLVDRKFSQTVGEVGQFSFRKLLSVPSLLLRLVKAIRRHPGAPIIYFLTNRKLSALVDWIALEVLSKLQCSVVLYIHTSGYERLAEGSRFWNFLVSRQFRTAERVVVLGPRLLGDVSNWVPQDRITIIPNAAGGPEVGSESAVSTGKTRKILFFSNLLKEKGADVFVRVAASLVDDGVDADFVLYGSSPDPQELAELQYEMDRFSERISYEGEIFGPEKWRVFDEASVLVFPSRYPFEAQPLTIIEAFSRGCPVVAYDIGGVGDIVTSGGNGTLVDSGDEQALTEEIGRLLAGEAELATLADGARESFKNEHSAEVFSARWQRVLSDLHSVEAT